MRFHSIGQSLRRAAGLMILLALLAASGAAASAANGAAAAAAADSETAVILMFSTPVETAAVAQSVPGDSANRAQRIESLKNRLKAKANAAQPRALARLEQMRASGKVKKYQPFWIANAVAVTVKSSSLGELSALPGVVSVSADHPLRLVDSTAQIQASAYANLNQVYAPEVWAKGYTGQGIVVANLDTGVNINTYSLASKYRGGSSSWYDVHGEHATPYDANGHGTATMEVMVADNVGVAPGARWMAVKVFADSGLAADSDAILGFEWLLSNPGGAPDVVNNSWADPTTTTTCENNPAMHAALQALVAANILPIFAAGNYDSTSLYSPPPSSYPEALAVGATDSQNAIASFSIQGPASCRPSGSVFPDISAPGVSISVFTPGSSSPFSTLGESGTSFAAPHVAGGLAVLLSLFPALPVDQQRAILVDNATDLGQAGPDNVYGYGQLNLLNAYNALRAMLKFTYLPIGAR